jgi:plastocyanin
VNRPSGWLGGRPGRGRGALLLLAVLGAGLVACGSGGAAAGTAEPVTTTSVNLPPSYRFEPAAITVAAGSTVTWTNSDNFSHSVQLTDGEDEPRLLQPGQTAAIAFDEPGTYPYRCHLHPRDMQGVVTVTP